MNYQDKSKEELIHELEQLTQDVDSIKKSFHDYVHSRKQVENTSLKREERFRFALEGATDGLWDWDFVSNRVFYSKQWKAMYGFEESEVGETLEESSKRIHPDDRDRVYIALNQHLKGIANTYTCEHRVICKDGTYKWILDEGKIVTRDEQGSPLRLIGTHKDITERKLNEFALDKRLKELDCHNQISLTMSKPGISIDQVAETMLQIIPEGFQFTKKAEVFINIYDQIFNTNGFKITPHSILQDIISNEKKIGFIEVSYCDVDFPDSAHIFLPEEYNLLFSIAERLGNFIEKNEKDLALQNSKQKYLNLIEDINDAIYDLDENGVIKYVSAAIEKIIGYTPAEMIGKNIIDFTGVSLDNIRTKITDRQAKIENEYKILSKSGTYCWISVSTKAKYDGDQLKGGSGIIIDITEKKLIELALQEREAQYKSILQTSPDTIVITDLEGKIVFTSPKALEMYKYNNLTDIVNRSMVEFIVEGDRERALNNMTKFYKGEFSGSKEYKGLRSDGTTFAIEVNGEFIRNEENEPVNLLFIVRDITDRKLAEDHLRKSEETYRELVENLNEVIFEIKPDGIIIFLNPAIERLTGYKPSELIGQNLLAHIYEPDLPRIIARIQEGTSTDFTFLEFRYKIKSGEIRWVHSKSRLIFDGAGNYIGRRGSFTDITDQKKNKEALEQSEERLRKITEQSQTVIWEVNMDGLYTYVSELSTAVWGYSPDEIINKMHFYDLPPQKVRENVKTQAFETFRRKEDFLNFENQIETKSGSLIWVSTNGVANLDSDGNLLGYQGADSVITVRKIAELALLQSEARLIYAQKIGQMGSWELNLKTNKVTWSKNQYRLLGLNPFEKEIHSDYFISNIHPDDVKLVNQNVSDIIQNKKTTSINLRYIMPDGKCKWLKNNTEPVFDGDELIALTGVDIDITERKAFEEKIIQHNDRLNAIVHAMPDLIFVIDKNGTYSEFYSSSTNPLTVDPVKIIGNNITNLFEIDAAKWHLQKINECIELQKLVSYEYSMFTNNAVHWFEGRLVPAGNDKALSFVRDISEKKQQENELKKLSLAVDQSPVSIAITDLNANIEYINPAFEATTGYSINELIGKNMNILKSGKSGKSVYKDLWKTIKEGNTWQTEWMDKRKNGTLYWESISINPIKNEMGEITNYLTVKQDITERKQSATTLQLSEERYRNIFVNSPQPIFIFDLETLAFLEVNNAAIKHYGYSRIEFLSMTIADIRPKEDIAAFKTYLAKLQHPYLVTTEWRHTKKTGEIIDVEIVSHTLTHNGRKARQVMVNDITEKKNIQNKILDLNANLELKIAERTIKMAEINANLLNEIDERKLIEKALTTSETKYRTVVNNVTEIIFQTDTNGLWIFLNKAWEDVTGFTVEESIGQLFVNYVHPDDRQRNMELFAPLINREKEYCRHQVRYLTKDGGYCWVEVFARLGLNEQDEITGTFGTLQDITESKKAKEALQLKTDELENFFTVALDLLCIADQSGNFVKLNKAWENTLGYTISELEKRNFLDFVHPDDLQDTLDTMSLLGEQNPVLNFINRYKTKQGSYHFIEWRSVPIGNFIYAAARDITDRKIAENEIVNARREAEDANLAKSEFLSRMSHELRTPLNSILGFAQLLEMGKLTTVQSKGVSHIMNSGNHLLNLINEVLDIAKIEAGQIAINKEAIQLNKILEETIDLVQPLTLPGQIKIELVNYIKEDCYVNADLQRLKQVLLNLLNNAIKYNRAGGKILIATERMQKDEAGLINIKISITDTGMGIAATDIPKLFSSFERIGADKTNTEGTGLGLAVVKKLMDAMDGDIGLESTPGEGSTFWIAIPEHDCTPSITENTGNQLTQSFSLTESKGTVLYIEDNRANIELVEEILNSYRPDIRLITNMYGMQTVKLAIDYKPDLILLDLNLPDIHGRKVIKLLKNEATTKDIPVIFISADAMPIQIEDLLATGAISYLTKPLDVLHFLKTIDEVFEKQLAI
jgi:PAS domain S-box-containing protein